MKGNSFVFTDKESTIGDLLPMAALGNIDTIYLTGVT